MLGLVKRHIDGLRDRPGDTIVEVMIVLAVLGLSIGISYATANHSLLNARQAQENSQASELVQSQIEQLRTQASNNDSHSSNYIYNTSPMFCMSGGNVVPQTSLNPNSQSSLTHYSNYAGQCINSYYHLSIRYVTTDDTFTVEAIWDDVTGQGTDTVTNSYRLHLISNGSSDASLCQTGYIGTPPNCTPAPTPPTPFLATTGCTGPIGVAWSGNSCMSSDTVAITVSGVNPGDTCTIRNDQGTGSGSWSRVISTSGNSCTANIGFSSFDPARTGTATAYLTAYVTDSGNTYKSNWTSYQAWADTPTHYACSFNGNYHVYGGVSYSNWTVTVNNDPCPAGTTCYTGGTGTCGTYVGNDPESYSMNIACQTGSIYIYGSTWTGGDNSGTPCPPGMTRISRIEGAPPGPPGSAAGSAALAMIRSAAYNAGCKLSGGSSCD